MKKIRKWYVKKIPYENTYYCEDGTQTVNISNQCCGACARLELISKHGGYVDLRGLYRYGICFSFLSAMNRMNKKEIK